MDYPADNRSDFRAICEAETSPFIRSHDDWVARRRERAGIVAKLSNDALDEWEAEALYRNGGLAHGSYALIRQEVGEDGLDDFLSLFGIGPTLAADHKDNYCESKGTCAATINKICTDNCFGGGGGGSGGWS